MPLAYSLRSVPIHTFPSRVLVSSRVSREPASRPRPSPISPYYPPTILTTIPRTQCDEAHPACRNCQKSKRECLGYDPIFKQQPGPSPIQPAPSSAPLQAATLATANPYGNQPSMLQGYGAQIPAMAFDASLSAGVSSPGSAQQFDYSSAIDPALEAAVAAPQGAPQFTQGTVYFYGDELSRSSPFSSSPCSPCSPGTLGLILFKWEALADLRVHPCPTLRWPLFKLERPE